MGKFVPPGSKVAVIAGMLSAEDHRQKTAGFSDALPRNCPEARSSASWKGTKTKTRDFFQKTFDLLGQVPNLAGLYVNTVNCLPVCRALGAGVWPEEPSLLRRISLQKCLPLRRGQSRHPFISSHIRQGQLAVQLMADNLTGRVPFPPTVHLSPGVVMSSNLRLFREIRLAGVKFDDSALGSANRARAGNKARLRGKTGSSQLGPPNQDLLLQTRSKNPDIFLP